MKLVVHLLHGMHLLRGLELIRSIHVSWQLTVQCEKLTEDVKFY